MQFLYSKNQLNTLEKSLKGGDRRVRIFSVFLVFLNLLRQGVKAMYYFQNVHSK